MATAIHTPHDMMIGFLAQTTWGTPPSAAGAFIQLPNVEISFNADPKNRRPNRAFRSQYGKQRYPDIKDVSGDQKGSMPTFSIGGDVRKVDLSDLYYLVVQNVTEGDVAAQYQKAFNFPTTQPDFTANAGFFGGFCHYQPDASTSDLIYDAIFSELTFTLSKDNEGRMQFEATPIGRGPMTYNFNPSGTWVRRAEDFLNFHDLAGLKFNFGSEKSLSPISLKWTTRNGAIPIGVSAASGKFLTFGLVRYAVEGSFTVLQSADSELLKAYVGTSTEGPLWWWWGNETPAANGDFLFKHNVIITEVNRVYPDGVACYEFAWEAVSDQANSVPIMAHQFRDNSDRGW